jgi:hypothetical protein
MSMRSVALTGVVAADRTVTVRVPDDVPAGPCQVVVTVGGPPEVPPADPGEKPFPENLIVFDVGPWPEGFTASREQLYDDDPPPNVLDGPRPSPTR